MVMQLISFIRRRGLAICNAFRFALQIDAQEMRSRIDTATKINSSAPS